MIKNFRSTRAGFALTFTAGWVDAVGFVSLSQIFVSAMSGNTTRLAVALAQTDRVQVVRYAVIIAMFFIGVVIGEAFALSNWRLRTRFALILTAVLILSSIFCFEVSFHLACAAFLTMSMGVLNSCVAETEHWPMRNSLTGTIRHLGHTTARYFRGELSLLAIAKIAIVILSFIAGGATGAAFTLNFNLGIGLILPAIFIAATAFFI